jgi:hypothetical protein
MLVLILRPLCGRFLPRLGPHGTPRAAHFFGWMLGVRVTWNSSHEVCRGTPPLNPTVTNI